MFFEVESWFGDILRVLFEQNRFRTGNLLEGVFIFDIHVVVSVLIVILDVNLLADQLNLAGIVNQLLGLDFLQGIELVNRVW